jgi:hypothetical protein
MGLERQCRSAPKRKSQGFPRDSSLQSAHNPLPNPLHNPLEDLRFIRETLERSGAFTAVPGWGQVILGVTALATAPIAARQTTPFAWIAVWLIEAGLALAIASIAMNYKSQRLGVALISGPARKFALGFLPPLAAGAIVTVILFRAGMTATLPGIWALVYGAAVITGGVFSVPLVPVMGACFMAAGALELLYPAAGNYAMAAIFGGLHILFGSLIARKHGG